MLKIRSGKAPGLWRSALVGSGVGVLWTVAAAAVIATMVDKEVLGREQIGYGAMAVLITASMLGSWISGKKAWNQNWTAAGISAGGYLILLLVANGLFFGGQYRAVGVTMLMILLGGTAGALLSGKGRGGHPRRRYKIPK